MDAKSPSCEVDKRTRQSGEKSSVPKFHAIKKKADTHPGNSGGCNVGIDLFRKKKEDKSVIPHTPRTNMPMATHTANELQSFSRSAGCITGSPRTFHNHCYNILGLFQMLGFAIRRTSQITRTQ